MRPFLNCLALAALWLIPVNLRAADVRGADVRGDFLKLIQHPMVPLAPEVTALSPENSLALFHFTFAADSSGRVPGILVEATNLGSGRRPVVIVLHGTGGTKEGELPLLKELAAKGFVAVAVDAPYHGERTKAGHGTVEYNAAIAQAWRERNGHPLYFGTVWEMMRLIDYLETRDDVDAARIGLYGVSKGGIETYLTAAMDPRVAVAVPCIGLQSFRWELDNNDWRTRIGTFQAAFDEAAKEAGVASPAADFVHQFYERVAPGIDGEFDGPAMVRLIAPRPMMAINGDSDHHTPLGSLKLCTDAAEATYRAAGYPERFVERIEPHTGHKVNDDAREAGVAWLVKWLRAG